jgi:protein-tyrosine kinase
MARNKKAFGKKKHIPYNLIWSKEKPISFITEAYQKFLANLEYVNVDKKYKNIQVTSSLSSEGKTTFLSNIAYLLGQKKYKVILLDLDLRKPKVHQIYDVENSKGITDYLADRVSLSDAIKSKKEYSFDIMNSGEKTNTVISLLESKKLKNMILELNKLYDYILIDSPPVINVSDALYISKISDAVLFVIAQNETKRGFVKEAVGLLKQNKVNIIGAILSQVDLSKSNYGYGYGYGYSYNYDYTYESTDD